jgi:hypothetical protein
MAIWFMDDKTAWYTGGDHICNVPANGSYLEFLEGGFILDVEALKRIMSDGQCLRVEGHVNREKYCYKYNRLSKEIPELPMFIPCDFDTRRTIAAKGGGKFKITGSADLSKGRPNPSKPDPN